MASIPEDSTDESESYQGSVKKGRKSPEEGLATAEDSAGELDPPPRSEEENKDQMEKDPPVQWKPNWPALIVVYITVFIDLLGFGIIIPLLPFYAIKLGANGFWLGVFSSAYSVMSMVGSIFLGRLSDRYGRKPILLISLLGQCGGAIVLALSNSIYLLILGRGISGLCGGSVGVAQAYVSDCTPPKERSKFMGMIGAALGLGLVIGPSLGGIVSRWGFEIAAFISAGLAGTNFLMGIFLIKESKQRTKKSLKFRDMLRTLTNKTLFLLMLCGFFVQFAFVGMEVTIAIFGNEHFGLTSFDLGLIYSMWGLEMAAVQIVFGRITKKVGVKHTVQVALILNAAAIATFPYLPNLVVIWIVLSIVALMNGFQLPALPTLLSLNAGTEDYGLVLGTSQTFGGLARAVAPAFMGEMYDIWYRLPYLIGAGCIFIGFLLSFPVPNDLTITRAENAGEIKPLLPKGNSIQDDPDTKSSQSPAIEKV